MGSIKNSYNFKFSKIFAIETSCDDTSLAVVVVEDRIFTIPWMQSFSQIDLHQQYGGVMPEIAYRSHAEKMVTMIAPILEPFRDEIDAIVVTAKPGLPGSLIVGITTACLLSKIRNKPIIEAHHVLGHVFSILCERSLDILQLPYVCLTASGGHNDLYLVEHRKSILTHLEQAVESEGILHQAKLGHYPVSTSIPFGSFTITKLGQTCDDAAGECFDKVARMLGGTYPGGKRISDLAKEGSFDASLKFHAGNIVGQPMMFSYSGLKSQVYNKVEDGTLNVEHELGHQIKANIAATFQEVICQDLIKKVSYAAEKYEAKTIGICGGVSANMRLREMARQKFSQEQLYFPTKFEYCTDNAGMIGVAGILDV